MSKPRSRSGPPEEWDFFSDGEFEVDLFMTDMEEEDALRNPDRDRRPARQRLEDLREWQWLRAQIADWDDWEMN